jgi:protein tyrosine/serine phosphatase
MKRFLHCSSLLIIATLIIITSGKDVTTSQNRVKAKKIEIANFHNLYKVDDKLYRSEQPDKEGFIALEKLGIKSILSLRSHHSDSVLAKGTGLTLKQILLRAESITYSEIVSSLKMIKVAQKPLLVHCWHGSDRTGCIVAAYRMAFDEWSKQEAIEELNYSPFGYNKLAFPNIVKLLNEIDITKLKQDVRN